MPPRKSKVQTKAPPSRTLVADNGAYTIKAGLVTTSPSADSDSSSPIDEPTIIPNCIARDRQRKTYVGSDLARCKDYGEIAFRRPVDRGYIVSWEAQREIWEHEFLNPQTASSVLLCEPGETRLLLAEQPNALPALQGNCDQMVFEEFGFASYYRGQAPSFNAYHDIQSILCKSPTSTMASTTTITSSSNGASTASVPQIPAEIMLLIDTGYSSTTITPLLHGRPLQPGIRRLDVGGKFLTNHLTRLLSLRHYDMRADTYIVNELKEQACFVSLDFPADLERSWKGARGDERRRSVFAGGSEGLAKAYILPDFQVRSKGVVREYDPSTMGSSKARRAAQAASGEDLLILRNERFVVPEVLFNPSDVGLQQPGIADLVRQSIDALPIGLWPGLLANIVVVGGNSLLDGFMERLAREIVERVPDECPVRVGRMENPIESTWLGAARFARHEHVERVAVTKQEYEEHGQQWLARKFAAGLGI